MPNPAAEPIALRRDDLSGEPTRQLIQRHLRGMHENSPPSSVHAFDVGKLRDPAVTFWSAWIDGEMAGCGALKRLGASRGEIKSMRVADAFLGRGVGRAVLEHMLAEARAMHLRSLWLEQAPPKRFSPPSNFTKAPASRAAGRSRITSLILSASSSRDDPNSSTKIVSTIRLRAGDQTNYLRTSTGKCP